MMTEDFDYNFNPIESYNQDDATWETLNNLLTRTDPTGSNQDINSLDTRKLLIFNARNYRSMISKILSFRKKFHEDYLSNEYPITVASCAVSRNNVSKTQGKLYITKKYICFYGKIFSESKFVFEVSKIASISKEKQTRLWPHGIHIRCNDPDEKFVFTPMQGRDYLYNILRNVWEYNQSNSESPTNQDGDVGGCSSPRSSSKFLTPPISASPTVTTLTNSSSFSESSLSIYSASAAPASSNHSQTHSSTNTGAPPSLSPSPSHFPTSSSLSQKSTTIKRNSSSDVQLTTNQRVAADPPDKRRARDATLTNDNTASVGVQPITAKCGKAANNRHVRKISLPSLLSSPSPPATPALPPVTCQGHEHLQRLVLDLDLPQFSVDKLFQCLFDTESDCFKRFCEMRALSDLQIGEWIACNSDSAADGNEGERAREETEKKGMGESESNDSDSSNEKKTENGKNAAVGDLNVNQRQFSKLRTLRYTIHLANLMRFRSSHCTEQQLVYRCSQPGRFYLIDAVIWSSGVPYANSFHTTTRYCLLHAGHNSSHLKVTTQINYDKNIFFASRAIIETAGKNGIKENFEDLKSSLLKQMELEGCKLNQTRQKRSVIQSNAAASTTTKKHLGGGDGCGGEAENVDDDDDDDDEFDELDEEEYNNMYDEEDEEEELEEEEEGEKELEEEEEEKAGFTTELKQIMIQTNNPNRRNKPSPSHSSFSKGATANPDKNNNHNFCNKRDKKKTAQISPSFSSISPTSSASPASGALSSLAHKVFQLQNGGRKSDCAWLILIFFSLFLCLSLSIIYSKFQNLELITNQYLHHQQMLHQQQQIKQRHHHPQHHQHKQREQQQQYQQESREDHDKFLKLALSRATYLELNNLFRMPPHDELTAAADTPASTTLIDLSLEQKLRWKELIGKSVKLIGKIGGELSNFEEKLEEHIKHEEKLKVRDDSKGSNQSEHDNQNSQIDLNSNLKQEF